MALPDKHDPRMFKHWAKVDASGVVLGIIEVAENRHPPESGDYTLLDVTGLAPDAMTAAAVAVNG